MSELKRYSVSFNSIIEADSEEEAIKQFWIEAEGATTNDATCFEYQENDNHAFY